MTTHLPSSVAVEPPERLPSWCDGLDSTLQTVFPEVYASLYSFFQALQYLMWSLIVTYKVLHVTPKLLQ